MCRVKKLVFLKKMFPNCTKVDALASYYGVILDMTDEEVVENKIKYNYSDPTEAWEIKEKINEGGFSKIYKVKNKKNKEIAVAKVIYDHNENYDMFKNEFTVLRRIKHKNIVKLHCAYEFDSQLWIVLEYCRPGSLEEIMLRTNKPFDESYIKHITKQVLKALIYLNEVCFVIHRDLKAANILLALDGEVKLADFGVSAVNYSLKEKKSTFTGSPYWISPDVIELENSDEDNEKFYNYKIDTWSLGMTCIELAEMEPPYSQLEPEQAMQRILNDEPPKLKDEHKWSPEFVNFLTKCLHKDPNERECPHDLYMHNFIKSSNHTNELMKAYLHENLPELFDEVTDNLKLVPFLKKKHEPNMNMKQQASKSFSMDEKKPSESNGFKSLPLRSKLLSSWSSTSSSGLSSPWVSTSITSVPTNTNSQSSGYNSFSSNSSISSNKPKFLKKFIPDFKNLNEELALVTSQAKIHRRFNSEMKLNPNERKKSFDAINASTLI